AGLDLGRRVAVCAWSRGVPGSCAAFDSWVGSLFFFSTYAPATEFYTLSLHDGSSDLDHEQVQGQHGDDADPAPFLGQHREMGLRSEEHTSELQSRENLVCRLLLEKKKKKRYTEPRRNNKLYEHDKRTASQIQHIERLH